MFKKTIAMLIAVLMIAACVPVLAFAAESPAPTDKYVLTLKSDNASAGSVTKTSKGNDTWEIVATANDGYKFVEWKVSDGDIIYSSNDKNSATAVIKVTKNATVLALFSAKSTGGSDSDKSPETGSSIALLAFACASSLAGAAFVAKKARK